MQSLTKESYEKYTREELPTLIEFSAPWCVHCRKLAPVLEQLEAESGKRLRFATVDIDREAELAQKEKIRLIPTLLLYQGGKLLGNLTAPGSRDQVAAFLEEHLTRQDEKQADSSAYDVAVIGGGPGGCTAALYAARAGLKTILFEKLSAGGQMALTNEISNYPGFEEGIAGFDLGEKMKKGAENAGAETRFAEVKSLFLTQPMKRIVTSEGTLEAKTVILATGAEPRELGIAGEEALIGKGVHYCATCDGRFYQDKTVVVVGGGNSAVSEALHLSRICRQVYLIHRRDSLRASKSSQTLLQKAENVRFFWDSAVVDILSDERVSGVKLENLKTGEETILSCDGVFISIGRSPANELVKDQLRLDENGYVIGDESTRTSIPGVFAAGDVRTKALRQIVTAVADGAAAAYHAELYLAKNL